MTTILPTAAQTASHAQVQGATAPGTRPRLDNSVSSWQLSYKKAVQRMDATIILGATALSQYLDFGINDSLRVAMEGRLPYTIITLVIAALWIVSLNSVRSSAPAILGAGHEEYVRILRSSTVLFGLLTIFAYVARFEEMRSYLFFGAPVGIAALLAGRWIARRRLQYLRKQGNCMYNLLLVGRPESARELISILHKDPSNGHTAVGICLPANGFAHRDGTPTEVTVDGQTIPVFSDWHNIDHAIASTGACTVAVMSSESLGNQGMRELSWQLDRMGVDLVVAPNLVDVDQLRVTTRPVARLPLLHIEGPRYEQANRLTKAVFDRIGSALLLLAFSPVLAVCALAVKISSRGPVFYRAERIGLDNKPFKMIKFRSMVTGADSMVGALAAQSDGNGMLFKMKNDPRVTKVGAFLRRYSLDELPQLINVFKGDMSLVGPRPPLRNEVDRYTDLVSKRLYVRPGMTGLWQVSGRSDLSWEESVRLDLTYIENWTLAQDLIILWRTGRAVVGSDGAY